MIVISDSENIILKPIQTPDISEFSALMNVAEAWAEKAGVTDEDIDQALHSARKR